MEKGLVIVYTPKPGGPPMTATIHHLKWWGVVVKRLDGLWDEVDNGGFKPVSLEYLRRVMILFVACGGKFSEKSV
jgi:hypothetical protein